jgi:hypothetical protein
MLRAKGRQGRVVSSKNSLGKGQAESMIVLVFGKGKKCTGLVVVALFTRREVDRKDLLFYGRTMQNPEHSEQ